MTEIRFINSMDELPELLFGLFECSYYHDGLLSAHAVKCAAGTEEGLETLYRHWAKNWDNGDFCIFQVDSLDPRTCNEVYLRNGSAAINYPHPGSPEDYGFLAAPLWFRQALWGSKESMKELSARLREEDKEQDEAEAAKYFASIGAK